MIRPSTTIIGIGATSTAALAYGALATRPGSWTQTLTVGAGFGGLLGACLAWLQEDAADGELTAHPALMNGYFITGGEASAISDNPGDVPVLAGLMGVPVLRNRKRRRA
jgi:hypothetical protein